MRDDFTFDCLNCGKTVSVNRTSSGEPIPKYGDEPQDFYISCSHCYGIFRVEYIVVLTEVMRSNVIPDKRGLSANINWIEVE